MAISYCAVEDCGRIQDVLQPKEFVRSGLIYKPDSMGQLTRDRPATAYESIAICHRLDFKKQWNGAGSYGIWRCNSTRALKNRHPNEKSIKICLKFVALFSNRGETVFDPFCGSAAIGEACLLLGRRYIGWDNDPQWVRRAGERLSSANLRFGITSDEDALRLCRMLRLKKKGRR